MEFDWNAVKEKAKNDIAFWFQEMTRIGANESVAECRQYAANSAIIYMAAKVIAAESPPKRAENG